MLVWKITLLYMQKEPNQGHKQRQGLKALKVQLYPNFLWATHPPNGRKNKQGKCKGEG